jgi:hypothetical protein
LSVGVRARLAASGFFWSGVGGVMLLGALGGGVFARLEWQLIEAERHLGELADPTRLRFVSAETIRARVPEWAESQNVRASAASTRVRISGQPALPELDDLATLARAVREATEPDSDAVRVQLRSHLVASMLGFERRREAAADVTIQVPAAGWSPTEDDEAFDGALPAPDVRPAEALSATYAPASLEVIAAYRILRTAERALAQALGRPALAAGPVTPRRWPGGAVHAHRLTETRRGLHRLLATPGAAGLEGLGPRGEEGVRTLDVLLARLEGMTLESVTDTARCEAPLALYAAEREARVRTIRDAFADGGLALP